MAKWDLSKLEKQQFDAAQARRFYLHVKEGGTLTERDVGRMVEALEEVFQMYVDANEARIDAEENLRKSALQELASLGQASEAYQAQLAAEEKLAKAVKGLEESQEEIDDYIRWEYQSDCPVHERYRQRDFAANPARIALAELKGQGDE